jgi:peptidoglycan/xylan/chitin deacetylase (PgdA/CDA1 family)
MKKIALTFDDGPYFDSLNNGNNTQIVLDEIDKINNELSSENKKIFVTFFVQGIHTNKSVSSLSGISNSGHEIGNHAWAHDDWTRNRKLFKRNSELVKDVVKTHEAIARANGDAGLRLFRPPLGHFNDGLWQEIKKALPSYVLAGWDYHPEADAKKGFEIIEKSLSNGGQAVYLLHELKALTIEKTIGFLKKAIPKIKSGEVSFVRASDVISVDKRTGLTLKTSLK